MQSTTNNLAYRVQVTNTNFSEMIAKRAVAFVALIMAVTFVFANGLKYECPASSKMVSCSPKCKDDTECFGQICCPNICNTKSCTQANQLSSSASGTNKANSKTATGSYCGNVKCNAFEKCEIDRTTKQAKCIRG